MPYIVTTCLYETIGVNRVLADEPRRAVATLEEAGGVVINAYQEHGYYENDRVLSLERPYLARCIGTRDDGINRKRLADDFLFARLDYSARCGCGCGDLFPGQFADGLEVVDALALLDHLLPTVIIDLPEPAAAKAREVCEAI
jgi:hypothetical protein